MSSLLRGGTRSSHLEIKSQQNSSPSSGKLASTLWRKVSWNVEWVELYHELGFSRGFDCPDPATEVLASGWSPGHPESAVARSTMFFLREKKRRFVFIWTATISYSGKAFPEYWIVFSSNCSKLKVIGSNTGNIYMWFFYVLVSLKSNGRRVFFCVF